MTRIERTLDTAMPSYYAYWGKAMPSPASGSRGYHLLAYHSLDVAAVGHAMADLQIFSLRPLAEELGWPLITVIHLHQFFLAIHDLGKFARAFQNLALGLAPALVQPVPSKRYDQRHDTLGWLLWRDELSLDFPGQVLPDSEHDFWGMWLRACTGHHGQPPRETGKSGSEALEADEFFCPADIVAARNFYQEAAALLLGDLDLPRPDAGSLNVLKKYSWRLAGIAVLADWLGSNQEAFAYHERPQPLAEYWMNQALPRATQIVQEAGLLREAIRQLQSPLELFGYLQTPTPLQQLATHIELGQGPQLFVLEDVTGAGKTEAALILAYRLMAKGHAHGLYFGLPTMATANQMYRRVGSVYRTLYADHAAPSLVLAHGARQLVDEFRSSILSPAQSGDADYQRDEASATSQCAAWLADNRKKSLLAHVGVGTLDQTLLGILPARHQSLRLLGLSEKVLLVDEVHAYDPYMLELLARLLTAHAAQGASAILLSATLPHTVREKLVRAYRAGLEQAAQDLLPADSRYPLVTHVHHSVACHACETRPELKRRVEVDWLHDEQAIITMIEEQATAGRSVCWIRNTVGDARQAFQQLVGRIDDKKLILFHSRYAMGDRLDIEDSVLTRFGKASTATERQGQVLIATQVVEQSLDLDFDVLITDLAPIDLLIQRAGRLHRHVRGLDGSPSSSEGRPSPVLHIFAPEFSDTPEKDWYSAMFPRARYVYPDVGRLWLTQKALRLAKAIVSPGDPGSPGGVRTLVEAVYGNDAESVPEALQRASLEHEGKVMADISQARFNALDIRTGYRELSNIHWHEEAKIPTRLGEETTRIFLAKETPEGLQAWRHGDRFEWEQSAVNIDARHVACLSTTSADRYSDLLAQLHARHPRLDEAIVLPLDIEADGVGRVEIQRHDGHTAVAVYDGRLGLRFE